MGVQQVFAGHGLDRLGLVVELEDRHAAALTVDHAQVADDAGQQLRLARVDQVGIAAAHDAPHLVGTLVEQIAGEVEIDDFAIVSGGTLVHQFTRISKHVMIQGGSRVGKDIPPYTLIGRDPIAYCGINIVGLRRRGYTNDQVFLIQDIYRTLYTRGLNNSDAINCIESEYEPSIERDLILGFIKSSSRGIVRGSMD